MLGISHLRGWTALSDIYAVRVCFIARPLSRRRWRIFCCARCWMMSRKMNYAASRRARCCRLFHEQWHRFTDGGVNQHSAAGSRGFRVVAYVSSVAPSKTSRAGGNVMYIPAAPMCEKIWLCARKVKAALETGITGRFPARDYETTREGRFTLRDLDIHGRRA